MFSMLMVSEAATCTANVERPSAAMEPMSFMSGAR